MQTLLVDKNQTCGIKIFNGHLLNFFERPDVIILHYNPSMWSGNTDLLRKYLFKYSEKIIVTIIHGIYPKSELTPKYETVNLDIIEQLRSIDYFSELIITLSDTVKIELENYNLITNIKTIYHPGLFVSDYYDCQKSDYVFLGGVEREKKSIKTKPIKLLIRTLLESNIKVWYHVSNSDNLSGLDLDIKQTCGYMSDEEWAKTICKAKFVLCPYLSLSHKVSGIVSEALSAGTKILSTGFDYAIEMQKKFPSAIIIENDFNKWASIINKTSHFNHSTNYISWNDFANKLNLSIDSLKHN